MPMRPPSRQLLDSSFTAGDIAVREKGTGEGIRTFSPSFVQIRFPTLFIPDLKDDA